MSDDVTRVALLLLLQAAGVERSAVDGRRGHRRRGLRLRGDEQKHRQHAAQQEDVESGALAPPPPPPPPLVVTSPATVVTVAT